MSKRGRAEQCAAWLSQVAVCPFWQSLTSSVLSHRLLQAVAQQRLHPLSSASALPGLEAGDSLDDPHLHHLSAFSRQAHGHLSKPLLACLSCTSQSHHEVCRLAEGSGRASPSA